MPVGLVAMGISALFALQFVLMIMAAKREKLVAPVSFVFLALLVWGAVSANMALGGLYDDPEFLRLLPGLWLPAIPFLIVAACLVIPAVRVALARIAIATPAHWLVGIQALRIAAIGTLLRTVGNDFPLHVELSIGLTDLVFGLSALLMFRLAQRGSLSEDALLVWHLVGFLIIIVPGEWAIQAGLPGPLAVYDYGGPHSSAPMLDFPMVLAPSLVVPTFLMLNLLGAYGAWKRRSNTLSPNQNLNRIPT